MSFYSYLDYVRGDLWNLLHRWHCYWWRIHCRWNLSRYISNCCHFFLPWLSISALFINASLFPFFFFLNPQADSQVNPRTTLRMLWRSYLSISGQTHEKLTSICFKKFRFSCTFAQGFLSSDLACVIVLTFWYYKKRPKQIEARFLCVCTLYLDLVNPRLLWQCWQCRFNGAIYINERRDS